MDGEDFKAEDFKRLPPRYDGTAEEVAVEPVGMPNAMTVEGYIAGIGKMAQETMKPGEGHAAGRIFLSTMALSLVGGIVVGFFLTFRTAFGL